MDEKDGRPCDTDTFLKALYAAWLDGEELWKMADRIGLWLEREWDDAIEDMDLEVKG